ncbi:hypothetical protein HAX54_000817, partial [Datura stramonium]|nr:hypothetical protein [Datura stramonium]
MDRNGLWRKTSHLNDNDDMELPKSSKAASVKENLPTQHGEELLYQGDRVISDYDGLEECRDDSNVRNMILSYKMHKEKPIEIYTLSQDYDIFMSTFLGENSSRNNVLEEVNEAAVEEHKTNST